MLDASRAGGGFGVQSYCPDTQRDEYVAQVEDEYYRRARCPPARAGRSARCSALKTRAPMPSLPTWRQSLPRPRSRGCMFFPDWSLEELRGFIDWTPFFRAWELHGNYPAILTDEVVGETATQLFADANDMLDRIIAEKWLTARGVAGLWPCGRDGDDIVLDNGARLPMLRQQVKKSRDRANMCLADFIDPSGDWIGGFAVGIHGIDDHSARFQADKDDYSDILLKALADRFAEAFAEALHQHVRKTLWGYAPDEQFTCEALIKEEYRGIRPAPGYPACPDHSLKPILFDLLDAPTNTGLTLTESFRDVADRGGQRLLFRPPRSGLFRCRPRGAGSGGGLRPPPRSRSGDGGTLAQAQPRLIGRRFAGIRQGCFTVSWPLLRSSPRSRPFTPRRRLPQWWSRSTARPSAR